METTKEYLENGYLIHNDKQISVEIDGQVILMKVENMDEFIKTLK